MKQTAYKWRYLICGTLAAIILLAYVFVDWPELFNERIVTEPGDPNYELIVKFYTNHIWKYFGNWAYPMHFTIISFVFFTIIMFIRQFYKTPLVKLLVLYSFIYCCLVFVIFFTMLAPFFPYDQTPKYLSIELGVHAIIPVMSYIMVKDKELRLPLTFKKDLTTFMILPVTYYIFNLILFFGTNRKAWTYFFLKFDDPYFANMSGVLVPLVNIATFILLLAIFLATFILMFKYSNGRSKKGQVN